MKFWTRLSDRLNPTGLRVLMYHKVSEDHADALTVTTAQFDAHLSYLRSRAFGFVRLSEVVAHLTDGAPLPPNPLLLTFDDGYVNNLTLAYPLLKRHGVPAALFLPTAYLGGASTWDADAAPLLGPPDLQTLDPAVLELALHSHQHRSYADLSPDDLRADVARCVETLRVSGLPFVPALAYPYGGRPTDAEGKRRLRAILAEQGVQVAFRIGNRVNPLPLPDRYDVNRIDVRGTDSLAAFRRKVSWGKLG
jgi:peptidoglycan/xylan/chitin deacetylase (PgdA/CDA1 family)